MNQSAMPLTLLAPLILLCALAFVALLYLPFVVVRRARQRRGLADQPPTNPLYLVAMVAWYLLLSIFGAPLILVWVLGPGQWWARHYFDRLGCTLDDRTLQFRKGILFRVEKTIPLENIQDVTFIEGPILRLYHLSILRVETAGQSPGQAHSMQLVGIVDAHALRDEILARRERLRMQRVMPHSDARTPHETLEAIRLRLDEIAAMMRARQSVP